MDVRVSCNALRPAPGAEKEDPPPRRRAGTVAASWASPTSATRGNRRRILGVAHLGGVRTAEASPLRHQSKSHFTRLLGMSLNVQYARCRC